MRGRNGWVKTGMLALALVLGGAAVGQTPGELPQGANIPKNMRPYFLCLLEKGEQWTPVQFADPVMQEHLAFVREQVEAGKFVVAGPTLDQGRIGGIAIINATTMEEAQKIANADKMVQSGRVTAEIHPVMLVDLSGVRTEYPAKEKK